MGRNQNGKHCKEREEEYDSFLFGRMVTWRLHAMHQTVIGSNCASRPHILLRRASSLWAPTKRFAMERRIEGDSFMWAAQSSYSS